MAKFKLLRRLLLDEQVLQEQQIRRPLSIARRDLERIHQRTYHQALAVINSAARNSAESGFLPHGHSCSAPGYPSEERC